VLVDVLVPSEAIKGCASIRIDRIKGIFRASNGWMLINGTVNEIIVSDIGNQAHSVLEVVMTNNFHKTCELLERQVQSCILA